MKVHCPNCPAVIIEFTQLLDINQIETIRCGNCGIYLSHFWDQLGVTYTSYKLTSIQEMRDESKEAKARLDSGSKRSNKRSKKRKTVSVDEIDQKPGKDNDPFTGSNK